MKRLRSRVSRARVSRDVTRRQILVLAHRAKRHPGENTEVLHDALLESGDIHYARSVNYATTWAKEDRKFYFVLFSPRKYVENGRLRMKMRRIIQQHFHEYDEHWPTLTEEEQDSLFRRLVSVLKERPLNAKSTDLALDMHLLWAARAPFVTTASVEQMTFLRAIQMPAVPTQAALANAFKGRILNVSGWQSAVITFIAAPPPSRRRR